MPVTLLDIAKANGSDAAVGLIDEAARPHPEIAMLPARTIRGLQYKTLVRTAVPTGSHFRNANDGVDPVKGTYENRLVETYIFNPRWNADKAVADGFEDGAAAYIAMEAGAIMEGAMQNLCTQFYAGGAKGFPGLIDVVNSAMVIDAGGSTAKSSLWGVRFGAQHVQLVVGLDGAIEMRDPWTETITGTNGKQLTAYCQEMLARPGLQVGSVYSVARIKNLGTDSGKGLTDDLIYAMLAAFPEGTAPDALFANNRSIEQLRQSRTAVNATGAPAPIPDSVMGPNGPIPLKASSAIGVAEA